MEPAMSDEELREYDAERALDYQEAQAWKRAQDQIAALTAQRDEARGEVAGLRARVAELERLQPHPAFRTGHRCARCGRDGATDVDGLCSWCDDGVSAETERDEARTEVRRLTAALATVTAERDGLWTRLGAHEGALHDTIARLRDEKAELRTQVDVVGDAQQRIAAAWNQIAGHFLVSPSPANAERIARLACAAAVVRDEAVAELQRLRAEHAAALATARREGAEEMRERLAATWDARAAEHDATVDRWLERGEANLAVHYKCRAQRDRAEAAAIRALPLDAPTAAPANGGAA